MKNNNAKKGKQAEKKVVKGINGTRKVGPNNSEKDFDIKVLKNTEKNIENFLRKSGYLLEIEIFNKLESFRRKRQGSQEWTLNCHPYFLDVDTKKERELDFSLSKLDSIDTVDNFFITNLSENIQKRFIDNWTMTRFKMIIECKKSERPWFFFLPKPSFTGRKFSLSNIYTDGISYFDQKAINWGRQIDLLDKIDKFYHTRIPCAIDICSIVDKKPQQKDAIFESSIKLKKALHYFRESTNSLNLSLIMIYYLVIVVDADIYGVEYKKGNLELKKLDFLQLDKNGIILDVVHKDWFDKYLQLFEKEIENWKRIMNEMNELVNSNDLNLKKK